MFPFTRREHACPCLPWSCAIVRLDSRPLVHVLVFGGSAIPQRLERASCESMNDVSGPTILGGDEPSKIARIRCEVEWGSGR